MLLAMLSLPLFYGGATDMERKLWQKLNLRILRHWVTQRSTERRAHKGSLKNVVERSRKNIAWHGILTFVFCFLMVRALFIDNVFLQYGSQLLLLPSIAYFVGSMIQRQKLVVIFIRKKL
jgi:hypothetical protein